ncbi:hypothetical protein Q5P01_025641 [Channa striata]|uniref:Ig-like domain-containing protein n=1 Tax=Channa striata TaxID=64152 RepID=A0AA88IMS7_CHASR|nr:hypothetical protein Q5P01_025641 [Channa striata]
MRANKEPPEPEENPDNREQFPPYRGQSEEQENLQYTTVRFSSAHMDPIYCNIRAAQPHTHEEEQEVTEYSVVRLNSDRTSPGSPDAGVQTTSPPGFDLDPPKVPSVSVSPSAGIVEGSSVTLTCSSDSNPAAEYTWYKRTGSGLEFICDKPQFVFHSIQSSDTGQYYCEAENNLGRRTSEDIFINVEYPPKVPSVSVSPSAEIAEGSSVTLSCSSDSNPAPKYTWYKKNSKVQTLTKEPQLVFRSIQSSDSGQYYCTAENELGRKTSEDISIDVKYPPKVPSVSVSPSAEIVEGRSVTLTCSSDSNPAATYTWYKENEDSPKASGQIFTINDIRPEHSGNYSCEAQNTLGRQNSTLCLVVVADPSNVPSVSVSPSGDIVEGSSVTLTCSSDSNPAAKHTLYKGNQSLPLDLGGIYHFTSISSEDRGTYYCKSEDQHSASVFIDVQYPPKVPSVSVSPSAEIVEGSSVTLSCSSDSNPAANYTWYKENEDSIKASGQIFTITDIRPEHSGNYFCEAQNTIGRENSTLQLVVVAAEPVLSSQRRNRGQSEEQENLQYTTVRFSSAHMDPIYCNIRAAQPHTHEEEQEVTEYSVVRLNSDRTSPGSERRHQWQNPSQPEDLSKDSHYSGRVQVSHTETGRSTLTITDLRDTDSAQYHFTFRTRDLEWTSSLPGTTLTVTALQVQVIRSTVHQFYSEAELKCLSSESPTGRLPFVWFNNGKKINKMETASYKGRINPGDNICCALKEHVDCPSTPVYPPKVPSVSVSPSAEIVEGSSVTLTCSSDSNPATNYTWYKKNQTEINKEPQLVFSSIQSSDSGHYYCTVENELGRRTSEDVFINVKSLQVQVIRSTVHQFYSEAELKCLSSESPTGRLPFVWFNNGKKINEMETASYKGRINPGDNICCALKEHVDSPSTTVYSPKVPSVSVSPSAEIVEGSSVTLTCSSDSNPAANYTWYKENQTEINKEPQLVFRSIQSSDSGQYYCRAENELGRRTSEDVIINVKYPPKVPSVSVSRSAEIVEGSSVTLNCSSDSNPAANYNWYKENEDSAKASGQIFTITDFRPEHSGNYYCEAQNTIGRQNSTLCSIALADPPKVPSVSVSPSIEIDEGSSVTLTCSSDSNPAANYTWYKENQTEINKEPQLVFRSIQSSDSGQYYCTAENELGRTTSEDIFINVKYPPKVPSVSASPSAEIVEGSSVTLTCSSESNPAANYTWYKENEDSPKASGQIFTITDFRPEHSGNYYCEAQNTIGRQTSTICLVVLTDAPKLPSLSVSPSIDIDEGSSVTLSCSSDSNPAAKYTWYKKNGNPELQLVSEPQLVFSSIRSSDSGDYYCIAENELGRRTSEDVSIDVYGVDGQSCNTVLYTDRNICALKGSSVDISCTYSSYGRITTKFWFRSDRRHQWQNPSQPEDLRKDSQYSGRVQVSHTETGRSTLTITDLREKDSAQYHFTFRTRDFEWTSSLPGTTLTVTGVQVQVIRLTVQESHTEAELECHSSCRSAARLSYVWFKNGEKITKETNSYKDQFYPGDVVSCALKGHEDYSSPSVYALKVPSVSASPQSGIMEGSSVTLTCSSDSNSAANYTWYKKNQTEINKEPQLVFSSIQSSESGQYYCTVKNELGRRTSEDVFINVEYPPKVPSVSLSPSAEIVEGSSVTLTCSSDSNPAANYTWYKENEDSPKASGQIFTITDFRPEHSGNYYCEAQNIIGRQNSTLCSIALAALQVQAIRIIRRHESFTEAELKCHSSCSPDGHVAYVWFKNGKKISLEEMYYKDQFYPGDVVSCAFKGHEGFRSPSVYAPKVSVTVASASAEIVEGSSVNLSCTSDANPPANHTWDNKNQGLLSKKPGPLPGPDPPKVPSVSVSPSAEIVEGSSVNLTCSSDSNPAANYTWYKENEDSPKASGQIFTITDFRPEHSGNYYCEAQNTIGRQRSKSYFIGQPALSVQVIKAASYPHYNWVELKCHSSCDRPTYVWFKNGLKIPGQTSSDISVYVHGADSFSCAVIGHEKFPSPSVYPPKVPSVSVSPSAEIVEGSSVNLTCSSDSNPAANYTWYKENEDSPKASGQIFTITDFRPEHSGNYYCEAQNTIGRQRSKSYFIGQPGTSTAAGVTVAVLLLLLILLCVYVWIRKKRGSKDPSEPEDGPAEREQDFLNSPHTKPHCPSDQGQPEDQENLQYAAVHFSKNQADAVYSNIRAAQPHMQEQEVTEYSAVNFNSKRAASRSQEAEDKTSALYSTINKN